VVRRLPYRGPGRPGQPTRGQMSQGPAMKAGEPATPPVPSDGPPPVIRPAGHGCAALSAAGCGAMRTHLASTAAASDLEWTKTQRTQIKPANGICLTAMTHAHVPMSVRVYLARSSTRQRVSYPS
jgi:hypothetical protein